MVGVATRSLFGPNVAVAIMRVVMMSSNLSELSVKGWFKLSQTLMLVSMSTLIIADRRRLLRGSTSVIKSICKDSEVPLIS